MDDISYETVSLNKFSESDSKDSVNFANGDYSSESTGEEEEEITEMEKQIVNHKLNLEQRLRELQHTMVLLRKQLAEEKFMWKKQLEEVKLMSAVPTCECHLSNSGSEEFVEDSEATDDIPTSYAKELTPTDFEEKLTKYQDALVKAQAEKRAHLRRQLSINNYKRRLLEVENMCNLELMRVQQNVQFLQPLQVMAQEWNLKNTNKNMILDEELTGVQSREFAKREYCELSKLEEVDATEKKFCNEMSNVLTKMQYCNLKSPAISSSNMWPVEDDGVGVGRTNSMIWHVSDCLSSSGMAEINHFLN